MNSPKITLACIVGNEEAVIERFIRSFAPAVDEFVFVRAIGTQKPDRTINITVDICNELGKEWNNRFYNDGSMPHVDDFGAARQMSWELALRGNPDYILWADADDILADGAAEAIRNAATDGKHDLYVMPYHVKGDKQVVMRERMVSSKCGSFWRHAIHEQLQFKQDVSYKLIPDAIFIHSPLSTKTGSHERNVNILSAEIEDAARNFFYLAQEHFQQGHDNAFATCAKAALACPGLGTLERYELLIQLAQTPNQESRKLAAEAFSLMPDRREAIALLCNYALIDGENRNALRLAEIMRGTPRPSLTYWSQNNEWYGWKGEELFRQCLRLNGQDKLAESHQESQTDNSRLTFSIIHATLGRPEKALQIREMWLSRAKHPENVEYIFGLHAWDKKSQRLLGGFKHTITDQKGPGWNYDTAAGASTGGVIIQAQDDCYPPDEWDVKLAELIKSPMIPAFVATNDGQRSDRLSVNTIMTRRYMEIKASRDPGENGFFHRGYATVYCDTENSFRAIQDGLNNVCKYIDARDFVIYHDHPAFNPSVPWDATYAYENLEEHYKSGHALFMQRNPTACNGCLDREPEEVAV